MAPPSEMKYRHEKLKEIMAAKEIDVFVGYSNQINKENVHFVANYSLVGPNAIAILPRNGEGTLLISQKFDLERACKTSYLKDVRYSPDICVEAANVIKKTGSVRKIGLGGFGIMTSSELNHLQKELDIPVVPANDLIDGVARSNTEYNIAMFKKAAQIADIGFEAFCKNARPGVREYELAAETNYAMRKAGADDNFQLLSTGKHNIAMHPPKDKKIERGDLCLAEITPTVDARYTLQACRTVCVGKPTEVQKEKYALLVKAMETAVAVAKPGVPMSLLARLQNRMISGEGYEEYSKPPYMRARGHGYQPGLGDISEENETKLEKGMVMVVHPNMYIPETGYLSVGESILITETGFERLSKYRVKLVSVGA